MLQIVFSKQRGNSLMRSFSSSTCVKRHHSGYLQLPQTTVRNRVSTNLVANSLALEQQH